MEKGLLGTMDDIELQPILQQAVDKIESEIKDQDAYDKILSSGKKFMVDPKASRQLVEGLKDAEDKPKTIGQGVAGIVLLLRKQSRGTMPDDEMARAASTLLMEALDALSKAGVIELSQNVIDTATIALSEPLLAATGNTKERMKNLMGNVQGVLDDPEKLAAYKAHVAKTAKGAAGPASAPAPAQGGPNGQI